MTQPPSSFLPDFCNIRTLFLVVLIAEMLAIVLVLAQIMFHQDWLSNLALKSLFVQWIALTGSGLLCILKRTMRHLSDRHTAIIAYCLILLVAFIITELSWLLVYVLPLEIDYTSPQHLHLLIQSLGITIIVAAIALRYLYIQHQWRRNIETAAQSQFQALQSRIRPHFLFNCMNTIASLMHKQPDAAERSIEALAELFRASLTDAARLSRLQDELHLCNQYLNIEKQRLGGRLNIDWRIDELPGNALIPPFTIQPLLENAIYHGIELIESGGVIDICGKQENKIITIKISNPVSENYATGLNPGHRIAQENIKQRLQAIYGRHGTLMAELEQDRYSITLCFPYWINEDFNR